MKLVEIAGLSGPVFLACCASGNTRCRAEGGRNMLNVLAIASECASGGADVGHRIAEPLSWEGMGKRVIEQVA